MIYSANDSTCAIIKYAILQLKLTSSFKSSLYKGARLISSKRAADFCDGTEIGETLGGCVTLYNLAGRGDSVIGGGGRTERDRSSSRLFNSSRSATGNVCS